MEYFLVKGRVYETPYMGDEYSYKDTRLVRAYSAEEAKVKYEDYWENRSEDYVADCYATVLKVTETLL